jgi:hypothetical protein
MAQSKKKVGKSEVSLLKDFCGRTQDDDLRMLADLLPQSVAFDRSEACGILQNDTQIDRWLAQSASADDFFVRIDSIGDAASAELEHRATLNRK